LRSENEGLDEDGDAIIEFLVVTEEEEKWIEREREREAAEEGGRAEEV
jgi:hypothetical protein